MRKCRDRQRKSEKMKDSYLVKNETPSQINNQAMTGSQRIKPTDKQTHSSNQSGAFSPEVLEPRFKIIVWQLVLVERSTIINPRLRAHYAST